jgi:hypothetical protein
VSRAPCTSALERARGDATTRELDPWHESWLDPFPVRVYVRAPTWVRTLKRVREGAERQPATLLNFVFEDQKSRAASDVCAHCTARLSCGSTYFMQI